MRAVSTHKPFDNPDQSRLFMWVLGTIPPPATRRLERIAEELTEVTGLELSEKDIRSFESKVPHSGFSLTGFSSIPYTGIPYPMCQCRSLKVEFACVCCR